MIFKYRCWPCDREAETNHPPVLKICLICMEPMELIQIGNMKIMEEVITQ